MKCSDSGRIDWKHPETQMWVAIVVLAGATLLLVAWVALK